ncbi:hypothetical protein [Variovorax soli]|uniref:Uncharacterized protein n=1 Tax=Variovorax soli TaxID=376815 RepID=A0ABU1NFN8_9BURK|nr:hypothetical protein [Variovorax soli]MDR6537244.1 hypothetical protein [Variovorax soli]
MGSNSAFAPAGRRAILEAIADLATMGPLRHCLLAAMWLAAAAAGAQQRPADRFPAAAMSFLGTEMPAMEAAIAARDRDYFEEAMSRMLDFSSSWGFKSQDNPELSRFPMCTEAVSDFLVVGMCRIMTTADACEPGLASRFNVNLQKCRDLAAR